MGREKKGDDSEEKRPGGKIISSSPIQRLIRAIRSFSFIKKLPRKTRDYKLLTEEQ